MISSKMMPVLPKLNKFKKNIQIIAMKSNISIYKCNLDYETAQCHNKKGNQIDIIIFIEIIVGIV